jgi:pyruvate,water dikinase
MVAINASWGLGLAVVGGEVTPDDWLISKVTGEVVREHVNAKEIEYEAGAVKVDVPPERQNVACLAAQQLQALVDLGKQIERYFGSHQDVEWAFDRDGALFVLQSRPVTALRSKNVPKGSAISMVMSMFGAGDAAE